MTRRIQCSYEKSFRPTSDLGVTLHWVKCIFGNSANIAISNAAQIVYFPSVLAEAQAPASEVAAEVSCCRWIVRQRMVLEDKTSALITPIPKRVDISFQESFDVASREGETFDWLERNYGLEAADMAFEAVRLIFLPTALAASPATHARSHSEAERSLILFEEKMTQVILKTRANPTGQTTQQLERLFAEFTSEAHPLEPPQSSPAPSSSAGTVTEPEQDFDDDYVHVEPDLDFK
jgi:hypothetical protein